MIVHSKNVVLLFVLFNITMCLNIILVMKCNSMCTLSCIINKNKVSSNFITHNL